MTVTFIIITELQGDDKESSRFEVRYAGICSWSNSNDWHQRTVDISRD